jgi:hypothetical protein
MELRNGYYETLDYLLQLLFEAEVNALKGGEATA